MQTGLLDALGYVGSSLDKLGGRAVRGVLGGHPDELASLVPFSDRLGITDPSRIVSGRNLTDRAGFTQAGDDSLYGHLMGAGAEIALDPTNLIGGGVAKGAAARAGRMGAFKKAAAGISDNTTNYAMRVHPFSGAGTEHINTLADALGPQYEGGIDKLNDILNAGMGTASGVSSRMADRLFDIRHNIMTARPDAMSRLAAEIPEGSKYLANGLSAVALLTPDQNVIRIGTEPGLVRAPIREVLQPSRSLTLTPELSVEHLPRVNPIFDPSREHKAASMVEQARSLLGRYGDNPPSDLAAALYRLEAAAHEGAMRYNDVNSGGMQLSRLLQRAVRENSEGAWDFWDFHPGNIATDRSGRRVVIPDAGAVGPPHGSPRPAPPAPSPALDRRTIEDLMYGPEAHLAVRRAIAKGMRGPHGVLLSSLSETTPDLADIASRQQKLSDWIGETSPLLESLLGGAAPPTSDISFDSNDLAVMLGQSPDFAVGTQAAQAASGSGGGGLSAALRPYVGGRAVLRESDPEVSDLVRALLGKQPGSVGFHIPGSNVIGLGSNAKPATLRHELGHMAVDTAVGQGAKAVAGLPAAWQLGAWPKLIAQKTGYGGTLGRYLDEAAQYGTMNRGLGNQVRGAADFLLTPESAQIYARQNPLLAAILQGPGLAAQNALPLALAGSSGGALLRQLGE